jgi:predicted Zn-dependent protease
MRPVSADKDSVAVYIVDSQGVQQYYMVPEMWYGLATAVAENTMRTVSGSVRGDAVTGVDADDVAREAAVGKLVRENSWWLLQQVLRR